MEKFLNVDDIGYFRSLAEAKLPASAFTSSSITQSWFSGWFGGTDIIIDEDDLGDTFTLSESQRKLFYKAIDYKEEEEDQVPNFSCIPREVCRYFLFFYANF